MKKIWLFAVLLSLIAHAGCGSGGTSTSTSNAALTYATFGETLSNAMPSGLKTGSASSSISLPNETFLKALSSSCATNYTDCPYITASGGGDSSSGEILMRLWGLDYDSECTDALLEAGTCFDCVDCETGSVGTTNFIKPTMLADPTECGTTSTTNGRYVNLGIDPCYFDSMIADISNVAECETVTGGDVNISSAIPWYSSWGLDQTVKFSSYYSRSDGGIWWTVNNGAAGNEQYFLSLDSNWLYAGIKDVANDRFIFIGTGSPAYYSGRSEGEGVNISAYAGTLSAIPASFEAIQVRDQDYTYIERMLSNGSHLWYQSWSGDDVPSTLNDVDSVKNSPSSNRCVEIGVAVVSSKYVPLADCVTSFDKEDEDDLNLDSNFTLKIIDMETAGLIDFSTALTPTTETSCLEEESSE